MTAPALVVPPRCADPAHGHSAPTWCGRLRISPRSVVRFRTDRAHLMLADLPAGWSVEAWSW